MKQIDSTKIKTVIENLNGVLADSFVLYYKTHGYHWNVEGPHFKPLHDMFMDQYTEMWEALDEIAERVRALDGYAPISVKALMAQASLTETGQMRDGLQMVADLAEDHESLAQRLAAGITLAEEANDIATADLLTVRLGVHEKTAWMLRATLK